MSLPFLRKKQVAGLIMAKRNPDGSKTETGNEQDNQDDSGSSMHSAASDLIKAIESKDISAVAAALKAAFQIADSEPHDEGEHLNEEQE
jgi:hypothetical protein